MNPIVALVLFVAASFAAAGLGSLWTARSVKTWYREIVKPSWTPPAALFGPVWTILYLLMAVAAWLVWRQGGFAAHREALGLYFLQLALNAIWSGLFFGLRRPGWALAEIVLLWLAIAATLAAFLPVSAWAAALLAPYLAWVSFATVLNAAIYRLNR